MCRCMYILIQYTARKQHLINCVTFLPQRTYTSTCTLIFPSLMVGLEQLSKHDVVFIFQYEWYTQITRYEWFFFFVFIYDKTFVYDNYLETN